MGMCPGGGWGFAGLILLFAMWPSSSSVAGTTHTQPWKNSNNPESLRTSQAGGGGWKNMYTRGESTKSAQNCKKNTMKTPLERTKFCSGGPGNFTFFPKKRTKPLKKNAKKCKRTTFLVCTSTQKNYCKKKLGKNVQLQKKLHNAQCTFTPPWVRGALPPACSSTPPRGGCTLLGGIDPHPPKPKQRPSE